MLKTCVRAGLGLAFLPKVSVEDELSAGTLKEVKVNGLALKRKTHILFRKKKEHREIVSDFIKLVLDRSMM